MNVLIVHAHHEPKSFSSSLANQAALTLRAAGHEVVISDLYSMGFDPVSDRRNFTSVRNPDYFKQQAEEVNATDVSGFAPDIEAEIQKLEAADAVVFSFPLWWFGMPAILKGWCDRVLASGRVYGGQNLYENGIGKGKKRGLVIMTTGGGPDVYSGWGVNPSMDVILGPIQHGIFWFNGILPLEPYIAWSPARISDVERKDLLRSLDHRLRTVFDESPIQLPPLADFPSWGRDAKKRFVVTAERSIAPDDRFRELVQAEREMLDDWRRTGSLLDFTMAAPDDPHWRAFFKVRASSRAEVDSLLAKLPLADYLQFEVSEIVPD